MDTTNQKRQNFMGTNANDLSNSFPNKSQNEADDNQDQEEEASDVEKYLDISFGKEFGQMIRTKRIDRGWTVAEMAKRVGYSEGHQVRVEYAELIPPPETVRRIAEQLEMPTETIVFVTQCLKSNKESSKNGEYSFVSPRERLNTFLEEICPCVDREKFALKHQTASSSEKMPAVSPVEKFRMLVSSVCQRVDSGELTPEDAHKIADDWKAVLE